MSNIIDRQTLIFSAFLGSAELQANSQINVPVNLRFAADSLVLKSLSYASDAADVDNMVQIWCNITNDNILAAFPNSFPNTQQHDEFFKISNTFQTSTINFQFQKTQNYIIPFYYNPQPLISDATALANVTRGTVSFTIEFLKHGK